MNTVIIVTGLPGAGKTTLATQLAGQLKLPLISRDALKEKLFDTLGWSDREWSKKLGKASIELLYQFLEVELKAGRSCIIESCFRAEDASRLMHLQTEWKCTFIQIVCEADGQELLKRFKNRALSGERHPGHVDAQNIQEFTEQLTVADHKPLDIDAPLMHFDTSDVISINYEPVLLFVQKHLPNAK